MEDYKKSLNFLDDSTRLAASCFARHAEASPHTSCRTGSSTVPNSLEESSRGHFPMGGGSQPRLDDIRGTEIVNHRPSHEFARPRTGRCLPTSSNARRVRIFADISASLPDRIPAQPTRHGLLSFLARMESVDYFRLGLASSMARMMATVEQIVRRRQA